MNWDEEETNEELEGAEKPASEMKKDSNIETEEDDFDGELDGLGDDDLDDKEDDDGFDAEEDEDEF